MKTDTEHTQKSETVLLYSVRVSGYKDYVSLLLGESEIFQLKTKDESLEQLNEDTVLTEKELIK